MKGCGGRKGENQEGKRQMDILAVSGKRAFQGVVCLTRRRRMNTVSRGFQYSQGEKWFTF